jgi:hypothetical protein
MLRCRRWAVGNRRNAAVVVDAIANIPGVILRRANVTGTGPIQANDILGNIGFRGFGASVYAPVGNARILVTAAETFDDAHQGTKLDLMTTPIGGANPQIQATFGSSSPTSTGGGRAQPARRHHRW